VVDLKQAEKSKNTKGAYQATFDISHLIKDMIPEEKTYLVFEV